MDFHNNDRAPLLLIAGGRDHVAPASVTKANYELFRQSKADTEYKGFPERTHYTVGQDGRVACGRHLAPAQAHAASLEVAQGD